MRFYIPFSLIPYTGESGTEQKLGDGQGGGAKTFTQDEVNGLLAKERRDQENKFKKIQDQVGELTKLKTGTDQEKADLESRLQQLQSEFLTKEEKAKLEQEKATKKYEQDLADAKKKAEHWQGAYSKMYINNEIITAATKVDAVSPAQILGLLERDAQVVPVLDEKGQAAPDQYKVIIKHHDPKTKKTLDVSPEDKMKFMLEDVDSFGNLFKTTLKGGLGGNNAIKKPTDYYAQDMSAIMADRKARREKGENV